MANFSDICHIPRPYPGEALGITKNKARIAARHKRTSFERSSLPYVGAALICERILKEEDGIISPMRVIDTINMSQEVVGALEGEHFIRPQLQMYLNLRTSRLTKDMKVEVFHVTPKGRRDKFGVVEFKFSEKPPGHSIATAFPVHFRWDGEGLYWFDIIVDGQILTKASLSVCLQHIERGTGSGRADLIKVERVG